MRKKGLYLVSRETKGYDEYDAAIICAYSPKEALLERTDSWEKVEFIGKAKNGLPMGCIISSFNAG